MLTDPQDFGAIYRNGATFTFDPLVEQVYRAFQLPETAIRRLYCTPWSSSTKTGSPNTTQKDSVNISHGMFVVAMRGKQRQSHALKAKSQLDSMMSLERICSRFLTIRDDSSTVVSLYKFCSVMVIAAGQASYFGNTLPEIDPSLPETFLDFEKLSWQIFYRPPILWSKRLTACKTKLLKAFEAYSKKPMEQRHNVPQFFQNWEVECSKAGLLSSDIAILMLVQYFGYVSIPSPRYHSIAK